MDDKTSVSAEYFPPYKRTRRLDTLTSLLAGIQFVNSRISMKLVTECLSEYRIMKYCEDINLEIQLPFGFHQYYYIRDKIRGFVMNLITNQSDKQNNNNL